MGRLAGKTAIVTGGASGIGKALCGVLAREGVKVVVSDIDADGAEQVAAALRSAGHAATARRLDVTRPEDHAAAVEAVIAEHGRLDLYVNNAGFLVTGEVRDLTLEHWRKTLEINLFGAIHGVAAAYPVMVRQRDGHIVNVASGYGLAPGGMVAPYVTSKFAVVGLSEALRLEAKTLGVRVTAICPGYVETPMLAGQGVKVQPKDLLADVPFPSLTPETCAARIVKAIHKGEAIAAFPFYVRALIRLYRSFPRLFDLYVQSVLARVRKLRGAD